MHDAVVARFRDVIPPGADHCSLRVVETREESLTLRRGVLEPPRLAVDRGAMITVHAGGGLGYAATSDLTASGLRAAADAALHWAQRSAGRSEVDTAGLDLGDARGEWRTPTQRPWADVPLSERLGWLRAAAAALPADDRLVHHEVALVATRVRSRRVTASGGDVAQDTHILAPDFTVVAHAAGESQRRGTGGRGLSRQGGWEIVQAADGPARMARYADEALALLSAPNCPSGTMSVLLDPDQMVLQIHESIGHPLELDRILGDERNYAGTSFVTPDMFGTYQYGSALLDVVFDPGEPTELATYGWDDDGAAAERQYLIRAGVLERPLGGRISQHRSGLPGVANSRASSWNRPPIDRMANLDVVPGTQTLAQLIAGIERGVWMQTNTSWSIDDRRDKFQFGCELGRLIVDGEVRGLVKNPNYRGRSASFWRNLVAVGDGSTREVGGSAYCGKGEPNQLVRVGHASPACVFADVDVFGGE
ncbi:MAG: putative Zn-dependent protease [Myxococcota bacterium]|jgi:predicted Zn-dependent protease